MSKLPTTSTAPSIRPEQRSGVIVAIGATSAPLKHDQPMDLWATPEWDNFAYEVIYNPARISLADAKASVRVQLAEYGVQVAGFLNDDGPLTAQQRGTEWMTRWGCPSWCINDHASSPAPDWHATAPVETAMRDIDSNNTAAENAEVPFLAARIIVVNDKPQAHGRETRVWLDYGTSTGELSPAEARVALNAIRRFASDLEAVVDQAAAVADDDFDGDPEIARLDREAEDRRIRAITEGRR